MRGYVALLLAALSLGFAPAPPPRPHADLKKVQGTWVLVSRTFGGGSWPAEGVRVVIAGARIRYYRAGEQRTEWPLTLDAAKSPKVFDQREVGGSSPGTLYRGIYRLEGDTLTLCHALSGASRPADFGGKDPQHRLWVFKRLKP